MKTSRFSIRARAMVLLWFAFSLFMTSACGQSLKGAKGPRVEKLGDPPAGMDVLWVAVVSDFKEVSDSPKASDREKALSLVFPSGVDYLNFLLDFKRMPPNGTKIGIDVTSKAGAVKFGGFQTMATAQAPSGEVRLLLLRKPENGKYGDGPYQGTVSIEGRPIARLNWTIGQ